MHADHDFKNLRASENLAEPNTGRNLQGLRSKFYVPQVVRVAASVLPSAFWELQLCP